MLIPVIPTSYAISLPQIHNWGISKTRSNISMLKGALYDYELHIHICLNKPWDIMALILSTIHCTNIQRNTAIQNQSLQKQWVSNDTLKEIIIKRNLYIIHINVIDVYYKTLSCPLFL